MKWVDGKDVSDDVLKRWIAVVDQEFGLTDRNDDAFRYMAAMRPFSVFLLGGEGYAVLTQSFDPWMRSDGAVTSFYLLPEARNFKNFMKMQKELETKARELGFVTLTQGCHLGNRLFKWLERSGFKTATMRKEL